MRDDRTHERSHLPPQRHRYQPEIVVEGSVDLYLGRTVGRNPYPVGSRDYNSWKFGWEFAYRLLQMRADDERREGGNGSG